SYEIKDGELTVYDSEGNVLTETVFDEEGNVATDGEYYTVVTTAALGHSYRLASSQAATCTEAGYELYVCKYCVDSMTVTDYESELTCQETAEDHEHTADCYAVTLTDYSITAATDETLYDYDGGSYYVKVTAPTGHSWDDGEVTKEATCTENGEITYTCTVCGETKTEEISSSTAHNYELDTNDSEYKAATCTEDGVNVYVCSLCKDRYTETVPATGHSYTKAGSVAATCEEAGYDIYTCENCVGTNYTINEDGTLSDGAGNVLTETVFDEEGNVVTAGEYYTVVTTAALGHSYRLLSSEDATCTDAGYELYVCKYCVDSMTVTDYESELTCQETAEDHEHTADCYAVTLTDYSITAATDETLYDYDGGSYYVKVTAPTGHSWDDGEVTKEATCTEEGEIKYTCTVCAETYTESISSSTAHDYQLDTNDSEYVAATCTEDGVNVYVCSLCSDRYTEEVPATGHSYTKAESVAATCEEAGYDIYTCENCVGTNYTINEDGTLSDGAGNVLTETVFDEEGNVATDGEYYTVVTTAALGHSYRLDSTVPATCGAAGYELYVCKYCADSVTVNDYEEGSKTVLTCTKDHEHTADCYTTEPTITLDIDITAKAGETVYDYDGGTYYVNVLAATGEHSYVLDTDDPEYVAATCQSDGTNVYVCSVCGDRYTETASADEAHSWNGGTVTTEPTCTEEGEIEYTCTECGETKTETLAATGHSYGEGIVIAPTCDEEGYTLYLCENCVASYEIKDGELTVYDSEGNVLTETVFDEEGNVVTAGAYYTANTTAALGHVYRLDSTQTVAATCTTAGKNVYVCKDCGDTYEVEIEPVSTAHTYDSGVVTAPTCSTQGYTTYTCTECGETLITDYVATLDHDWGEWEVTTAATHTSTGEQTRTCKECGTTETQTIAKTTEHSYTAVVTEPTCTTAGYTTYTCACGATYVSDIKAATGHNYSTSKITTAATHTSTGVRTYYCADCGATYTTTIAKTTAHSYKAVVTAPTCTAKGYTTYTCACGSTYRDNYTAATGHSYSFTKYSVKATRNNDGKALYTCSQCGATKTKSYEKIASWSISVTSYTYDGNKVVPKITVKDSAGDTISSKYYCYQYYAENTSNLVGTIRVVGKYYVKVTFKTKYAGSIVVGELTVKPKTRSIQSLTAVSQGFKVTWTALKSTQISGYQIQYSTSKDFSSKTTVTVSGNSKSSKKITGLKSKTKYYVRIRTYKKNAGVTYYSSWSSIKSITTKK
ncbi:MAG: fibronectin type III domain-containing protein, partial [Clostridiales bacterium]|nr:fibronectin type III domain-containing protein [Clostridiales bacterium]